MTAPLGNPFALGNTGVQTAARIDRIAMGASFFPGAAAVSARNGVLAGPAGTMGELTLLTDILLRVAPFVAVIQGTHAANQGQYVVPNDTQRDLAVPAKDASQSRKILVQVRVADSLAAGVASSAATDGSWLELKVGALAASNPVLPGVDANSVALGELSIPSTASGLPVTLTKYDPRTTTRGGILPVLSTDVLAPIMDGQYRDHPTLGLQRGKTGVWRSPFTRIFSRSTELGAIANGSEFSSEPRQYMARIYCPFGGLSYSVINVNYASAGFTDAPHIFVGVGNENSYSLYGGYDQITSAGCICVIRAGVNIAGGTEISFLALGR